MKKILLIEKMQFFHRRLKENYDCRLTIMVEVNRIGERDRDVYDRIIAVQTGASFQEWLKLAQAANEIEHFDTVVCLFDAYQIIARDIAEKIGVKFLNKEATEYVNDKHKMREMLEKAGLSRIHSQIVKSKQDVREILEEEKTELIIKPKDGRGSINIIKIGEIRDIDELCLDMNEKEYVAETFAVGNEYSVEAVSYAGRHKILCVTKKIKYDNSYVEKGHIVPANIDKQLFDKISDYVEKVLKVLKVEDGATHTEIMVNDKEEIDVIETHVRFGGDCIPEIVNESSGIDVIDYHCAISIGDSGKIDEIFAKEPLTVLNKNKFTAVMFKYIDKDGVIGAIKNLPVVNDEEGIIRVEHEKDGTYVHKTNSSFNRGMMVMVSDLDYQKCIDKVEKIIEKVEYIYEE